MVATGLIRYWAAARSAAGVNEESFRAGTLAEATQYACSGRDAEFVRILGISSILIDGNPVGARPHSSVILADGMVIEVLPPFAGG